MLININEVDEMGNNLFVLCGVLLAVNLSSQAPAKAIISLARTVSSIPVLELGGKTLAGVSIETSFFDDHPMAVAELIHGSAQLLLTGSTLAIKNSQAGGSLLRGIRRRSWDAVAFAAKSFWQSRHLPVRPKMATGFSRRVSPLDAMHQRCCFATAHVNRGS
jgi:hypothetical protein